MCGRTEQQRRSNNLHGLAQIPSDPGYSLRRFVNPRAFNTSPGGGDRLHMRCELPLTWALRLLQGSLREQPWRQQLQPAVAPEVAGNTAAHDAVDATEIAVMSHAESAALMQQRVARSRARARARMRRILRALERDLRGLGV
ncbi:hypothetical protein MMYC01_207927 [Madurella mycetomatis]|uniref:Uncharacterized protein n=1 Tax=Madurella mycetomatis TaxID=100816 RepID=A0A175W2Y6_9PEZI|nr:hypothetical protein MMYC01_207927 [Madurella mycetomatis]